MNEPDERVRLADQRILSGALEDIVDVPDIDVDTEAALSDQRVQRVHDRVQRKLGYFR